MPVTLPHAFVSAGEGIPDRGCLLSGCGLPDRDPIHQLPMPGNLQPAEPTRSQFPCCEAEVCKRAADFGSTFASVGRDIVSDHDHLMVHGKHYHLHCAPPAVEAEGFHTQPENEFNQVAQDAETDGETVDWLIDRVSSIVQEAPQAEREPLLYRAHVLGVLHQARAMERIAERLDSLCAELVKPEGPQGTGQGHSPEACARRFARWQSGEELPPVHQFMPHTGGGNDCYLCGFPFDAPWHPTATGPDAEADPAEGMRRVEGGE